MESKQLKTLLLFDLACPPPVDQNYDADLKSQADEWESEASVLSAIRALGHDVKLFGIHDDVQILLDEIKASKPDLVFNLCEAFRGDRDHEPNLAALLELMSVRYTGARPVALRLCKDKALAKKILSYHGIRTAQFEVSRQSQPLQRLRSITYPALVKPLGLESSTGIAQDSFVESEAAALERVRFVHERLGQDAIIEEYIDGRELYVGVIGNERLEVLPPRELFFEAMPTDSPKIATYKAKWDDAYRERWGIKNGPAKALEPKVLERIEETCKKIYKALQITGYARIDLRLTPGDEVVFLEANPNPSIAEKDDFAQAALAAGMSYEKLIAKLIRLSEA